MLLVMRHAKSDWNTATTDHERPLNKRGVESAKKMGTVLSELSLVPDRVIASTAKRAITTARLAIEAGAWESELIEADHFYGTSASAVINELSHLPASVGSCMVIGHNPTWESLVFELTGARAAIRTATVAAIETPGAWSYLDRGGCQLYALLQPRLF